MNFIDETPSTLSEYFESIGKQIFSHRKYKKIVHDTDNLMVFPCPSSTVMEHATKSIEEYNSSFYILHTAHFTGNYYLVLTKFEKNIYKVFYVHNNNDNISYSYYAYG